MLNVGVYNQVPLASNIQSSQQHTAGITISVQDVNEPPTFITNHKYIRLQEGVSAGQSVCSLMSKDPDIFMQQSIRYWRTLHISSLLLSSLLFSLFWLDTHTHTQT